MAIPKQKSKTRFSSLDIKATVNHLAPMLDNTRLTNIYTVNKRTLLFKFAKATMKFQLLIESGQRIHIVGNDHEKQASPSNFTTKLKKHLKGKRFFSIKQLGVERMIQIEMGYKGEYGSETLYLILEMYAKGNIILCDENYTILALIRNYKLGPEVSVMPKEVYPVDDFIKYKLERYPVDESTLDAHIAEHRSKPKSSLTSLITGYLHFVHQVLAKQTLVSRSWNPQAKISTLDNPEKKKDFLSLLSDLKSEFAKNESEGDGKWYTYWSSNVKGSKRPGAQTCFDFSPLAYEYEHESVTRREESNPSRMMEMYFGQFQIEEDYEQKQERIERVAMQKYERIKRDQETRLEEIRRQCASLLIQAQMIEKWQPEVQGIISTVVEMIKCGLSNIVKVSIAQGQKQGDDLALMVQKVDISRLELTLELKDDDRAVHRVLVNLKLNASKNAQVIYNRRKKLIEKENKTKRATKEVLKKAHALAKKEIRNQKLKLGIRKTRKRKQLWFEKFYWFLSGGRYLIISARDAQQNETLVKKYARKTDIVLHAQIQGCAFTVIKDLEKQNLRGLRKRLVAEALQSEANREKYGTLYDELERVVEQVEAKQSDVVPFYVLLEAATATLGHSKAWIKKVAVEVYWVFGEQVSKTAPSGLSLPTGSFMIYGKKNFVPVHKMEMGFGLLFKVEGEAGKREIEKKEQSKMEWVTRNLFGEQGGEKEDMNKKMSKKYGGEEEKTGIFWEVMGEMKREREGEGEREEEEEGEGEEEEAEAEQEEESIRETKEEPDKRSESESTYTDHGEAELIETKFKKKKGGAVKIKKKTKEERKKEKEEKKTEKIEAPQIKKKQRKRTKKERKKMKKYLERYGDETEEETALRMKLMGFGKNYLMEKKKKDFKWNKEAEDAKEPELLVIEFSGDEGESRESAQTKAAEEQGGEMKRNKTEANSKKMRVPKNIDSDSDSQAEDTEMQAGNENPFRQFTGYPKEGDRIVEVIPVCSAYMTLSRYKYKVKLLTGSMKRGKIWKMVSGLFAQQRGINELEKKLIKGITDNEAVQQLIGGCKVQAPGLQKIIQKQKKAKKNKRKNKNK